MKAFLIVIYLSSIISLSAQESMVKVKVNCTNFSGKSIDGEQIWFKSRKSQKIYKGITDESGFFEIELKGPDEYMIMLKSVGKASDYTQLIFPTLKPGQTYGTYEVTVEIEPSKEFTLDNVYFETGKSVLKKESFVELDELFEYLSYKKTTVIEIGGHTDNTGSEANNLTLSKNRAESVKNYLVQKGIKADQIITKGYGENRPIADNNFEEGRSINRRTEVRIIKE